MQDTTNETTIPEEQGTNDVESTGAVKDTDKTPSSTSDVNDGRTFKQADVDSIVKERLAEDRKRREKDFEKKLADSLAEREKEFDTLVQQRVQEALSARELEIAKKGIAEEYSLTETQMSRLSGSSIEELRADAQELFGAMKYRKAPTIVPGTNTETKQTDDVDPVTAAVRRGIDKGVNSRRR